MREVLRLPYLPMLGKLARRAAFVFTMATAALLASVAAPEGPTPADAAYFDTDLDGHPDAVEIIAGSDPTNPLSTPEENIVSLLTGQPLCTDGVDNDLDGLTDALDSGCVDSDSDLLSDLVELTLGSDPGNPASTPEDAGADTLLAYYGAWFAISLAFCADGIDNDLDGLTDALDPGCAVGDSDGDTFPDSVEKTFGSQPGTALSLPENEAANAGSCSDAIDNDLDGATDALDPGCNPPSYIFPIACTLNDDCFYVNYVDETPGGGISDYTCGLETYDGHQGTDITLKDFVVMDQGVDVYAVEDGTILAIQDGFYDRNTIAGSFPSNLVIILHPNGYRTAYLHLRNGSVIVSPGDVVSQGQKIAEVGSSGSSTQPHLHFHVADASGAVVDPWAGPCGNATSFWQSQDPYEDFFLLIDSYLLAVTPTFDDLKDGPSSIVVFPAAATESCYATQVLSIHDDTLEYRFISPSNVVAAASPFSFPSWFYVRHWFFWGCASAAVLNAEPGQWRAEFYFNGGLVSTRHFGVGSPGDTDGDGCSDIHENGPDETLGGQREYDNPWDFYDVAGSPLPPQNGAPDGVIDLPNDILGVIQHHPSGTLGYDAQFDRGPWTGPNSWNETQGPDGVIDLPNDILGVILQFNHRCV